MEYTITYGNYTLHALSVNRTVIDGKCELEAGTDGTLTFGIAPDHDLYDLDFKTRSSEVRLEQDGVELFRGFITKSSMDIDAIKHIECTGVRAYLKDSVVRPCSNRSVSDLPNGTYILAEDEDPINYLINRHNERVGPEKAFTVGSILTMERAAFVCTDYPSTFEALNDNFCTGLDRYLYAYTGPNDTLTIDLLDGGKGEGSQVVVLGENIIDLQMSKEAEDVITAIVARGTKDDKDDQGNSLLKPDEPRDFGLEVISDGKYDEKGTGIVVLGDVAKNPELVSRYGYREEMRKYEAKTGDELLQAVGDDLSPRNLKTRELESAEVKAVDLAMVNPNLQPIRLLEWVRIFSTPHGIDQWLPCSKISIDISNPVNTTYIFGDLARTLTRESALRLGLQRKGTGELIRKAEGQAFSSATNARDLSDLGDTVVKEKEENDEWKRGQEETNGEVEGRLEEQDKTNDEVRGLIEGLQDMGDGLTGKVDKTLDGLAELEEAGNKARADFEKGIQDLSSSLDEKIGGIDSDLSETNTRLEKAAEDAMNALYSSVYVGVCTTAGNVAVKEATVTAQNGKEFELKAGVLVQIVFQHANTAASPQLKLNGGEAHQFRTNGFNNSYWLNGQAVPLIYDGNFWMVQSSPVWTQDLTVGNPLACHLNSDGTNVSLQYGNQPSYFEADTDGVQIGMIYVGDQDKVGLKNVHIDNDGIVLRKGDSINYLTIDDTGVQVGMDDYHHIIVGSNDVSINAPIDKGSRALKLYWQDAMNAFIQGDRSLTLKSISGANVQLSYNSGAVLDGTDYEAVVRGSQVNIDAQLSVDFTAPAYTVQSGRYPLDLPALVKCVRTSIVLNPQGSEYFWINKSDLGLGSEKNLSHYAFLVTNGDLDANDAYPIGTAKDDVNLVIKFDRVLETPVRVNIIGFQCDKTVTGDPGVPEGPSADEMNEPLEVE